VPARVEPPLPRTTAPDVSGPSGGQRSGPQLHATLGAKCALTLGAGSADVDVTVFVLPVQRVAMPSKTRALMGAPVCEATNRGD